MPRRSKLALGGAAATVGLLVFTWLAAFHVGVTARADVSILNGFTGLDRGHLTALALFIARLCDPKPYVYLAIVPVLVALLRRRPGVALTLIAIMIGANASTELLKPLLAHARPAPAPVGVTPVGLASWPSGHATAAMSLALCCVIAAPARFRPKAAALGAVFAVAVSYSFLTLAWHYPSDVFGGYLVATTWTLLGAAGLLAVGERQPREAGAEERGARLPLSEALGPPALALAGALTLALVVVIARPHAVVAYARAHTAFIVGAAAIGVLGLALATGLMLTLRGVSGSGPAPTGALRHRSPPG
jgi:membrane-associated phospholipid phosphatase